MSSVPMQWRKVRLARAGLADDRHHLALVDPELDAAQHLERASHVLERLFHICER